MDCREIRVYGGQVGDMQTHHLKIWPEYFAAVTHPDELQRKTLELRRDDRGYQVGDTLVLQEFDPETKTYTGSETGCFVTHIVRGQPYLNDGYVAMSIRLFDPEKKGGTG